MVAKKLPEAEPAAISVWIDGRIVMLELTDGKSLFTYMALGADDEYQAT